LGETNLGPPGIQPNVRIKFGTPAIKIGHIAEKSDAIEKMADRRIDRFPEVLP